MGVLMKILRYGTYAILSACVAVSLSQGGTLPVAAAEVVPPAEVPAATWLARLLGSLGLPMLLIIAGIVLGVLTAVIVILAVRVKDKRRASVVDARLAAADAPNRHSMAGADDSVASDGGSQKEEEDPLP